MTERARPPKWFILFFLISLIAWPLLMYWLANSYSGWSELKRYYNAGEHTLKHTRGRTNVTLVQASGRTFDFASKHVGQRTQPRTDVGFDDAGFWIKGIYGGWTGGPIGAVFIPWHAVKRCYLLRVELDYPEMALIIHDQPLLDACACKVSGQCK